MTMLISFLPNFIGRRDCNAGGRISEHPPTAGGQDTPWIPVRLRGLRWPRGQERGLPLVLLTPFQKTFFARLPVEIRGVLVYDGRKCMREGRTWKQSNYMLQILI